MIPDVSRAQNVRFWTVSVGKNIEIFENVPKICYHGHLKLLLFGFLTTPKWSEKKVQILFERTYFSRSFGVPNASLSVLSSELEEKEDSFFYIWILPRANELIWTLKQKADEKKKHFFKTAVTFRKINIFRWDFFKTISTRSENSISGLTVTFRHPEKRYQPSKW